MAVQSRIGRLGFSSRLIAIVLLSILIALTLSAGLLYMAKDQTRARNKTLLPGQIAAAVMLIEGVKQDQYSTLLRAINTTDLSLSIVAKRPETGATSSALPAVEWLISQQFTISPPPKVKAFLSDQKSQLPLSGLLSRVSPFSNAAITITVALTSGETAVFRTTGSPASRIFGMPPGFWIGALGGLLALLAVLAVIHQAKPLTDLEASLDSFSKDAAPRPVPLAGAPDLKRLISATNTMQHRISGLVRGRSLLMASISHDLRSFLTRLRLRVELLPIDTDRGKAIRDIEDMTILLEDALVVARGQSAPDRFQRVDVAQLLRTEMSNRASDALALSKSLDDVGDATIGGDQIALQRLIANLVDNALRYATYVVLGIERLPGKICLTIDDDGPGIIESERQSVFEPFYRLDRARSVTTGGNGLGLAIVKQIAEAHHATAAIETSPMGGARFIITFPDLSSHSRTLQRSMQQTIDH